MSGRQKNKITTGGNIPRPGQTYPTTIILTQAKRFGIDIADVIQSVRAFENVDYSRRYKLYDLYSDILMDPHLTSVIEKRILSVLSSNIDFRREGKPDKAISEQIRSPWFRRAIRDIMEAQFWGFSLMQFRREGQWVNYDLVPRKHADPIRRIILRQQTDITGIAFDEFSDLLFVGAKDDLGLLAKATPWVIYKRNTTIDWAQFSEVFGMPIREYVYETDDTEARQQCINEARNTESLAVIIHSSDSKVNLLASGNKTGSAEIYERLCERCNSEISKLMLGNTLTTEASQTGTQALGTIHNKVEERIAQADRRYVLDILNYDMIDIFISMGINTAGGEFCFPEPKSMDLQNKANMLTRLHSEFGLPISDDYLYEEFGIEKPANYKKLKAGKAQEAKPQLRTNVAPDDEPPARNKNKALSARLRDFFCQAPHDGAALDW
jgi:phage gp29-like protein